jgi:hypothetical protein
MTRALIALAATGAAATVGLFVLNPQATSPAIAATPARAAVAAPANSGADAKHPVVLELFQSQGCSSCPPANKVLDDIANRADVLALNFSVTYWDQLGWKDIYGQQAFTDRQWEYSRAQGRGGVQTPQLIVNGRAAVLGSYRHVVDAAIIENSRGKTGPAIAASASAVTVGASATAKPATIWLVDYDPRTLQVPIRNGENGGRTLPHRDIVKRLIPIGNWTGQAGTFARKPALPNTVQAVLVQQGKGGTIVAAAKI